MIVNVWRMQSDGESALDPSRRKYVSLGIIEDYTSLDYVKSFQGCGSWTMRGVYTQEARRLLVVGRIISAMDFRICGIIRSVEVEVDEDGNATYTAKGREMKDLLSQRIVWGTFEETALQHDFVCDLIMSQVFDEMSLKAQPRALWGSSASVPTIVTRQAGSTKAPDCQSMTRQISWRNLAQSVQECLAAQSAGGLLMGYDLHLVQSVGATIATYAELAITSGADRTRSSASPLYFSRSFDNMGQLSYLTSLTERVNDVVVGGEGEGAERVVYEIQGPGQSRKASPTDTSGFMTNHTGPSRYEAFVDARDLQSETDGQRMSDSDYAALLLERGRQALSPTIVSLVGDVRMDAADALDILGARVEVFDAEFGASATDYVYEVQVVDDQDGTFSTVAIGKDVQAVAIPINQGA